MEIAKVAIAREYSEGDYLIRQSEHCESIIAIVSGNAMEVREDELSHRTCFVNVITRGTIVANIAAVEEASSHCSVLVRYGLVFASWTNR